MPLTLDPGASVLLLARWIGHNAFALAATLLELPCENAAILKNFGAMTIHVCVFELSRERLLQIGEEVHSMAFEHALCEVALVVAPVGPLVPPSAVFLAVDKLALVHGSVGQPRFRALPVLAIIAPLALVPVPF